MATVALTAFRRPAVVVGLVVNMFAFEQWAQGNISILAQYPPLTNILIGLLVLWALGLRVVQRPLNFQSYPALGWLILALYGFAFVSYVWTEAPGDFVAQWRHAGPYLLTIVVLLPLLVDDVAEIKTALLSSLAIGALVGVLALSTLTWGGRGFVVGPFGAQTNPLAIATAGGLLALAAMMMHFQGMARVFQVARWGIVALGFYMAVRSGSRGQTLALLISAMAFLPFSRKFSNIKGLVGTVVGLGFLGVLAMWLFQEFAQGQRWALESMLQTYQGSRLSKLQAGLSYWIESGPLAWVIGLGNTASFDPRIVGYYPHVVMGEILVEEGIIGLSLFGTALGLLTRQFFQTYRLVRDEPELRGLITAITAMTFFLFILSFKQGSLLGHSLLFGLLIISGRACIILSQHAMAAMQWQAHPGAPDAATGGTGAGRDLPGLARGM